MGIDPFNLKTDKKLCLAYIWHHNRRHYTIQAACAVILKFRLTGHVHVHDVGDPGFGIIRF
jgi:hypothetical protein